jgi:hypothetical protein
VFTLFSRLIVFTLFSAFFGCNALSVVICRSKLFLSSEFLSRADSLLLLNNVRVLIAAMKMCWRAFVFVIAAVTVAAKDTVPSACVASAAYRELLMRDVDHLQNQLKLAYSRIAQLEIEMSNNGNAKHESGASPYAAYTRYRKVFDDRVHEALEIVRETADAVTDVGVSAFAVQLHYRVFLSDDMVVSFEAAVKARYACTLTWGKAKSWRAAEFTKDPDSRAAILITLLPPDVRN